MSPYPSSEPHRSTADLTAYLTENGLLTGAPWWPPRWHQPRIQDGRTRDNHERIDQPTDHTRTGGTP